MQQPKFSEYQYAFLTKTFKKEKLNLNYLMKKFFIMLELITQDPMNSN